MLYVLDAQRSLPRRPHVLYVLGTRTSLGRALGTASRGYHPSVRSASRD